MSDLSKVEGVKEWLQSWRDFYAGQVVRYDRSGDEAAYQREKYLRRVRAVAKEQRANLERMKAQGFKSWASTFEYERAVGLLEEAAKGEQGAHQVEAVGA